MGRVSRYQAPSIHHVVASPYLGGRVVWPCLPTKTHEPPSGGLCIHEIKHDGFRIIARKNGEWVRLYSRPGNDRTDRFPRIVEALEGLRSQSCIIDGEAVACEGNGMPSFDRIRYRQHDASVFLYAFDLLELDGDDLRHEPIERRKALLIRLLAKASAGLQVNDHIVEPGDVVFRHACQLGFEGIVSNRLGSPYRSGRSRHWVKSKNPQHKREAEDDSGRDGGNCLVLGPGQARHKSG
jgi:bifunctional non-homologous end joining protein LigD